MFAASVGFRIGARVDDVWSLANWLAPERLVGRAFFDRVEFSERDPVIGATRTFGLPARPAITERLTSYDDAGRVYDYRLVDCGDLPVCDYDGRVCATKAGKGTHLSFMARCVLVGVEADEFRSFYVQAETSLVRAICDLLRAPLESGPRSDAPRGRWP